ncbi:MAG: hypothetical protein C4567_18545 [Deltaproteobacteria bacterium]|nr:MAG: hypothetical protein C4567_18545 [Deltaproteobacteria bacterium]
MVGCMAMLRNRGPLEAGNFLDGHENMSHILLTLDAEVNHKVKREKRSREFAGSRENAFNLLQLRGLSAFRIAWGTTPGALGSNFIDRPGEA